MSTSKESIQRLLLRCTLLGSATLTLLALGFACSSTDRTRPPPSDGPDEVGQTFVGRQCRTGETRDCSITIAEHAGVLTCFKGVQDCQNDVWSECRNGELFTLAGTGTERSAGSADLAASRRFLALSQVTDCENNPCDPSCQNFDEVPDGGPITPPPGDPVFDWEGGTLGGLPSGLVNKGIKEPCQSAFDCQFNRRCQNPSTGGGCEHSKCQTGGGLVASCDPCVEDVCAAKPECCSETYEHSCAHSPCETGDYLKKNCDDCVGAICDVDADCCDNKESWTADCVAMVDTVCGLECPLGSEGSWTSECVDLVDSECGVTCGESVATSCTHNVCDEGDALDARCHSCVAAICAEDPYCCAYEWDSICVDEVPDVCGGSCPLDMSEPASEDGSCAPWLPGQTDSTCDSIDLSVDVPCDDGIPVCNHGTETAPAGVRLIHFPANSDQYPKCEPDQSHPQMYECFTPEAIPPGHCVVVTDCPQLIGNREIMVNPPGDDYVDECRCQDNWSLYSGGSCEPPECAGVEEQVAFRNVNLMFVMDRSGSMEGAKWTGTTAALKGFFENADSAGLNVGLEFFPLAAGGDNGDGCGEDSCDSDPCSNPMVAAGELTADAAPTDTQEDALVTAVDGTTPDGETPTYPALDGALTWATAGVDANPDDFYAVILVTDGSPTVCGTSTFAMASLAVDAYINYGVKTYTIGMDEACTSCLDTIAAGGGTGSAFVIGDSDIEGQLIEVFQSIAQQNSPCIFEFENMENVDPEDASLVLTPTSGSPTTLPQLSSSSSCGDGWHYDDNESPTSAALCSSTCQAVLDDPGATLDLQIGCIKQPGSSVETEIYNATCPTDQRPQWGFLTWASETPGSGNIVFRGRLATSEDELADADWVTLGTATSSPDDTQDCTLTGPDGCPIDLYDAVGGVPEAHFPYMELEISLNSGSEAVTLESWRITYSCVDSQ